MNAFVFQTPPPAGAAAGANATTTTTQVPTAPTDAAPQGGQPGGGMGSILFMVVAFLPVILLMWFTSRSQQKKQKALEARLKKGDRVLTQSGLVGKIAEIGDPRYIKLEIAPGVRVQMLKTAIAGIEGDVAAAAAKSSGKGESAPASDTK